MKIIPFDDRYLEETVKLFCEVYSTEYRAYSEKWAKERILNNLKTGRDYSFVAVSDDGKYLGALICKSDWGDQGKEVHIDSNQVVPGARRQGVGEKLMEAVVYTGEVDKVHI